MFARVPVPATRARCVSPCGAKQKAVGARTFRRHIPNDSPRCTRMIIGQQNAVPLIRIARLPPAGQRRDVTHSKRWARQLGDAPPTRKSCRYRSGSLRSGLDDFDDPRNQTVTRVAILDGSKRRSIVRDGRTRPRHCGLGGSSCETAPASRRTRRARSTFKNGTNDRSGSAL